MKSQNDKVQVRWGLFFRCSFGLMGVGAILVLLFGACERSLDLDLGEAGGKPVLYSFLQPDSALTVGLSKSVSILSLDNYQNMPNASLMIFKNNNFLAQVPYPDNEIWASWPQLSFGQLDTVRISVWSDGAEITSAQTIVSQRIEIETVDTARVLKKGTDGMYVYMMKIGLVFTDPVQDENFYQLILFQNKEIQLTSEDHQLVLDTIDYPKDDKVFYNSDQGASTLESIDFQGLFNDEAINGKRYRIQFYLPIDVFDQAIDVIRNVLIFRLYHLDQNYYSFMRSRIIANSLEGLPIFSPVRSPSNVANGYGMVASLACSSDTVVIR